MQVLAMVGYLAESASLWTMILMTHPANCTKQEFGMKPMKDAAAGPTEPALIPVLMLLVMWERELAVNSVTLPVVAMLVSVVIVPAMEQAKLVQVAAVKTDRLLYGQLGFPLGDCGMGSQLHGPASPETGWLTC